MNSKLKTFIYHLKNLWMWVLMSTAANPFVPTVQTCLVPYHVNKTATCQTSDLLPLSDSWGQWVKTVPASWIPCLTFIYTWQTCCLPLAGPPLPSPCLSPVLPSWLPSLLIPLGSPPGFAIQGTFGPIMPFCRLPACSIHILFPHLELCLVLFCVLSEVFSKPLQSFHWPVIFLVVKHRYYVHVRCLIVVSCHKYLDKYVSQYANAQLFVNPFFTYMWNHTCSGWPGVNNFTSF